ncbi:MAG: class I SAM-dependent methyltransferase [Myxococcaceae bacterium]|nr:class I SAM-dependent methyltransferase [Myxococcaceae bacterium]
MADPFPLYLPSEARRLFQSESLLRRFAQAAHFTGESRLLEIHASLGGLALARALNCQITMIEPDPRVAETLKERARMAGLGDAVTWLQQPLSSVSFADQSFDGIFSLGRVIGRPSELARRFRPWLAEKGRLAVTCVMAVGRQPAKVALESWADRLGHAIVSPRDTLMSVEPEGFEPEIVESLGDPELDDFYREIDAALAKQPSETEAIKQLKAEITVHRAQQGKAGATYGVIVARRKEPGEKPPLSRDGG